MQIQSVDFQVDLRMNYHWVSNLNEGAEEEAVYRSIPTSALTYSQPIESSVQEQAGPSKANNLTKAVLLHGEIKSGEEKKLKEWARPRAPV